MRELIVLDKTLNAQNGRMLLFREKIAIAKKLDQLGVNRIELPCIIKEKEDQIIAKTISMSIKNSTVVMPCALSIHSVDVAYDCIKECKNAYLSIMVPVSTVTMEYEYHKKESSMNDLIREVFTYAKGKCGNVEFVAKDATRSNPEFLKTCIGTAISCGANAVTLCDDEGTFLPDEWKEFVSKVGEYVDCELFVQINDKLKMGVASAVNSINSGVSGIYTSILGDSVVDLADFAKIVESKGQILGFATKLRTERLKTDVSSISKDLVVDGNENDALASGEKYILITKDTTMDEISRYVADMGYSLSSLDVGEVYKATKNICDKKDSISTKEFEAIIASYSMQVQSTYHLESYNANCSNISSSVVHVALKSKNDVLHGVSIGNGPIDAAFMAIEQCIGHHYELDAFQIEAVTEGKEALGSAIVKLRDNGKLYSGNGVSSDIVGASIRAYLNALNKIVAKD